MAHLEVQNIVKTFGTRSGVQFARALDGVSFDVEKGEVTGIKVRNIVTDEVTHLPADGVFIAIGHQPTTDLFKGQLELTETGYVVTDGVKTSIKGVFAAGDVQDELYRQAITAAGTGCMAALECQWLLENEEVEEHEKKTLVSQAANQ